MAQTFDSLPSAIAFSFIFPFQFNLVIVFLVHIMTLVFLIAFQAIDLKKSRVLAIFGVSVFENDLNHFPLKVRF